MAQDTPEAVTPIEGSADSEEQWEYCALQQSSLRSAVMYYGEGQSARNIPYAAWDRAIGVLGLQGWELAGATAAVATGTIAAGTVNTLYFKRRVKPGRRVDEPALVL